MVMGLVLVLVSGLASPAIFAPSLAVGWFARRWWQVLLGAVAVAVLSQAEVLLIELPDATPDWAYEPLALIAPVAWCAAGFLLRSWYRRASLRRSRSSMRALPVVIGMVLGALVVGALALGVGLLYLRTGQLEFHTVHTGGATGPAGHETVFFQYLFPGLLLGQLAGGLIGRVLGRPITPSHA
jgi:hypothetical protein